MGYSQIKKHYIEKFGNGNVLVEFPDSEIIVTIETQCSVALENILIDDEFTPFIEAKENRVQITYSPNE